MKIFDSLCTALMRMLAIFCIFVSMLSCRTAGKTASSLEYAQRSDSTVAVDSSAVMVAASMSVDRFFFNIDSVSIAEKVVEPPDSVDNSRPFRPILRDIHFYGVKSIGAHKSNLLTADSVGLKTSCSLSSASSDVRNASEEKKDHGNAARCLVMIIFSIMLILILYSAYLKFRANKNPL